MTDLESEADELRASLYIANKRIKELENETELWKNGTIEQLEDDLALLMEYMKERPARKLYPSGKPVHLWDDFTKEYPAYAAELEKWLEERHGDD